MAVVTVVVEVSCDYNTYPSPGSRPSVYTSTSTWTRVWKFSENNCQLCIHGSSLDQQWPTMLVNATTCACMQVAWTKKMNISNLSHNSNNLSTTNRRALNAALLLSEQK